MDRGADKIYDTELYEHQSIEIGAVSVGFLITLYDSTTPRLLTDTRLVVRAPTTPPLRLSSNIF